MKRNCKVFPIMVAILLLTLSIIPPIIGATAVNCEKKPPAALQAGGWPMYRRDPQHTGFTGDAGPTTNQTAWSYATGDAVTSSPAVVNDRVYVGSFDKRVYCLDAATGDVVWNYTTEGFVESSPAVADGKVYIGSDDGYLYCLDADDGSLVWRFPTGGEVKSSPVVFGGKVYVGSLDKKIYCLDADSGTLNWSYTTGDEVWSSPAIYNERVYVGSNDGNLYCLDAYTGALVWKFNATASIRCSPAILGGNVLIGTSDGKLYCVDGGDGSLVWGYTTAAAVYAPPAVTASRIYLVTASGRIYCLNTDGAFVWSKQIKAVYSAPSVAGDKVYVGSEDRNIYCLDANTGEILWKYATGGAVKSSPAIVGSKMYVGSGDGKVYAFGGRDVAITRMVLSDTSVEVGDTVTIVVVAENQGSEEETFDVTVYYDGTAIGTQTVTDLAPGETETLSFMWDTTPIEGGNYTIKAVAETVPREVDTADNTYIAGVVEVIQTRERSTLTISISPETITYGEEVTINGSITPTRVGARVSIMYRYEGATWRWLADVTTDPNGRYSYVWKPKAAREYEVMARWDGDNETLGDESEVVHVTVNKANATMLLAISTTETTTKEGVTIEGAIHPPVEGVNVTISYRPSEGNWSLLAVVATDEEGAYTYVWKPPEAGTYEIKAAWDGNENYLGAESNVVTIKVRKPAPPILGLPLSSLLLIGLMAVITIAIIVLVVVVLRFARM